MHQIVADGYGSQIFETISVGLQKTWFLYGLFAENIQFFSIIWTFFKVQSGSRLVASVSSQLTVRHVRTFVRYMYVYSSIFLGGKQTGIIHECELVESLLVTSMLGVRSDLPWSVEGIHLQLDYAVPPVDHWSSGKNNLDRFDSKSLNIYSLAVIFITSLEFLLLFRHILSTIQCIHVMLYRC